MSEIKITEFTYQLSKIYLEIIRSVISQPLQDLYLWYKQSKKDKETQNKFLNTGYSILSISCIYSYLSIESFCNWQLWEASKYVNAVKPDINRLRKQGKNLEPLYGKKFKPYGSQNYFSELKEKIKDLCKYFKLDTISKQNQNLWDDFSQLLTDTRHFFVHPKPFPEEFQKYMKKILGKQLPIIYVKTAEEILKYFYKNTKRKIPTWLQQNELFKFKGIEIL